MQSTWPSCFVSTIFHCSGDNSWGVYYTNKLSPTDSSDFFDGFVVDDDNIGLLNNQFIGGHHIVKTATAFGKYLQCGHPQEKCWSMYVYTYI